jgi:hypothetical protein
MSDSMHTRRRLLTIAAGAGAMALAPGLAVPAFAGDEIGTMAIGDPIHRSTVIDRAWTWVNRGIQYSQQGVAEDAERNHTYRRDCSGFVSMCWHLRPSGLGCPWTGSLGEYSRAKAKANLQRGDILLDPGNHVVLFQRWTNAAQTTFMLFELGNTASDMNHREASLSSYSGFTAREYNKIVDG